MAAKIADPDGRAGHAAPPRTRTGLYHRPDARPLQPDFSVGAAAPGRDDPPRRAGDVITARGNLSATPSSTSAGAGATCTFTCAFWRKRSSPRWRVTACERRGAKD